MALEPLEPRQLLAADLVGAAAESEERYLSLQQVAESLRDRTVTGATIVTHGFQLTDSGGDSLLPLAQSLLSRADRANGPAATAWLLDYDVVQRPGGYTGMIDGEQSILASAGPGEVVLLFDWARESNKSSAGWGEAAGDALFNVLVELGLASPNSSTAVPLHFIGHSFGTAVTSAAVERLVAFGIPVDQVTYLDPHDFDQFGLPVDGEQELFTLGRPDGYGATTWQGVAWTDVWYQTDAFFPIPDGRPIPGAYNVLLNDQIGGLNPHSAVWTEFYQSTIARDDSTTGYAFSRLGGAARPDLRDASQARYRYLATPASAQDHAHSPPKRTDGERTLTADELNFTRWEPDWNPLLLHNGDFEHGGLLQGTDLPGWMDHGGGGLGHVDCVTGPCYLELDSGNERRAHNRFFIPAAAQALVFETQRTDASPDDQLVIRVGGTVLTSLALTQTDAAFTATAVSLPAALRGTSQVVEFALIAGGTGIDSEVRIDRVRLAAWQNPLRPTDVNRDRFTAPLDALLVINEINRPQVSDANGRLPLATSSDPPFYDVNNDGFVAPTDVLMVVNHINRSAGEGESASVLPVTGAFPPVGGAEEAPPVISHASKASDTRASRRYSDAERSRLAAVDDYFARGGVDDPTWHVPERRSRKWEAALSAATGVSSTDLLAGDLPPLRDRLVDGVCLEAP